MWSRKGGDSKYKIENFGQCPTNTTTISLHHAQFRNSLTSFPSGSSFQTFHTNRASSARRTINLPTHLDPVHHKVCQTSSDNSCSVRRSRTLPNNTSPALFLNSNKTPASCPVANPRSSKAEPAKHSNLTSNKACLQPRLIEDHRDHISIKLHTSSSNAKHP